jgi:gas vesicle protein
MANGHDGFDRAFEGREGRESGGSFVLGLLTGTVLGAGLGMLFAPKIGSELRNQLSEQAGNIANQASEGYRRATESAGEWAEKGRDVYNRASEAVVKGTEEAQKYLRETARS